MSKLDPGPDDTRNDPNPGKCRKETTPKDSDSADVQEMKGHRKCKYEHRTRYRDYIRNNERVHSSPRRGMCAKEVITFQFDFF